MLKPIVFGLNYQTANLELRNQLAFASDDIPAVLKRLVSSGVAKEAILLSTCNRTELYCITSDINFVINALCDIHNICPRSIRQHSYIHQDDACAKHLFRVISGLDSMVLGESEIVAQIKSAMDLAKSNNVLGTNLAGLFQMALAVEKDVRSHTAINNVAISMGHAIVSYVAQRLPLLPNRKVLFVGAGQMMQQIAPHFNNLDFEHRLVLNRTLAKAEILSNKIMGDAASLCTLPEVINEYAVVVLCCASSEPLVNAKIMNQDSRLNNQLMIDVSMPLVIDKDLHQDKNITILTIDDIASLVDVGIEKRKLAAIEAESLIEEKMTDYHLWQRKRGFAPLIRRLRDDAEQKRLDVVANAEKQLMNGVDTVEVVNQLSQQIVNKLLHQPTVNLLAHSGDLQHDLADLVVKLYGLED